MSIRRLVADLKKGLLSRETVERVSLTSGSHCTPKQGIDKKSTRRILRSLAIGLGLLCLGAIPVQAAETSGTRVEAILVWATHVAKTNDTSLKELEPQLAQKLGKRFKWNLYYEVRRKEATVGTKDPTHVPISDKCSLDVKQLGEHRFEVNLTGKGKPVSRMVESLANGHLMILGGDDKNDTAWIILIRELPAKK